LLPGKVLVKTNTGGAPVYGVLRSS
jgi:hypothetical protein